MTTDMATTSDVLLDKAMNDLSDVLELIDDNADALVQDDNRTAALAAVIEDVAIRVGDILGSIHRAQHFAEPPKQPEPPAAA